MTLVLTVVHLLLWATLVANLNYLRRRSRRPSSAASTTRISILIPARDEAHNLRRLLPSLFEQDHPSFEVIVFDDGSTDATPEVLQAVDDERLRVLRGEGPPPGWVGKVHALYRATRAARGDQYLFLDADACLQDPQALRRLADRFDSLPPRSVLTGLTRLRGAAPLLVSLVPNIILCGLPWPLVARLRAPVLSALNGQCWMIRSDHYHRYEPHERCRGEVLEDVEIGRYLKRRGLTPVLDDVQREVSVFMYASFTDAWRGFRKNAYLILGGTPLRFATLGTTYLLTFVLAPFLSPWLLLSVFGLKLATDVRARFPVWLPLLAPLSFVLAVVLQWDSAIHHWIGRVTWKGRRVDADG